MKSSLLLSQTVHLYNDFQYHSNFTIQIFGMYVSSAEMQYNIKAANQFERDASVELNGGFGYGAEITYFPNFKNFDILFYISSEYLNVKDDNLAFRFENDSATANVRFSEQYKIYPIEAGLKWNLPVSTEKFKVYIGGGTGIYFGSRIRQIGPFSTYKISSKPGFSLNVLAGLEYFLQRNLSANFEFKFREANFESKDSFDVDFITINQNTYGLDNPQHSRFLIDGPRISIGLKYHF